MCSFLLNASSSLIIKETAFHLKCMTRLHMRTPGLYPSGLSLGLSPTDFQKIEYCKLLKSGFKYVSASFIHMILWAYNIISLCHRVKLLKVQISVVECHLNLHLNDQITKLATDNNSHTHTHRIGFSTFSMAYV